MRTRIADYARVNTRVTAKQTILSALDAFIAGLVLVFFIGITLVTGWLIFGH